MGLWNTVRWRLGQAPENARGSSVSKRPQGESAVVDRLRLFVRRTQLLHPKGKVDAQRLRRMCKAESTKHASTLPVMYHGLTNDNRFVADDLTLEQLDKTKEMIIRGRVYDVSGFIKRHPGGKVITFQLGSDASDAYNNFHMRSPKADKMLRSLPNRPVDASYAEDALSADYQKLYKELMAARTKEVEAHVAVVERKHTSTA